MTSMFPLLWFGDSHQPQLQRSRPLYVPHHCVELDFGMDAPR